MAVMTRDEQKLAREIGLVLRRLRQARGLTQKDLAQCVAGGVDGTYIGKIERGEQLPSLKVLIRLSRPLGVTVSDFFYPPPSRPTDQTGSSLHLEPLLHALQNRGIDGIAFVRAILDALGQYVLVTPPRRVPSPEGDGGLRADPRMVIHLPAARKD